MLSSKEVDTIFMDCLFHDNEDTSKHIPVGGLNINVGFHPERLESHREEVKKLLSCLDDSFKEEVGGGMTTLNMVMDREGNHWGEQMDMQKLLLLGLGLGIMEYCLPRTFWAALPGGMPYVRIKKEALNG